MKCTSGAWAGLCIGLFLSAVSVMLMLATGVFPVVVPMACFSALSLVFTAVTYLLAVVATRKVAGLPCGLADMHTTAWCLAAWVPVVVTMAWNPAGWTEGTMRWVGFAVDVVQWLTTSGAFLYDMVQVLWRPDPAYVRVRGSPAHWPV